MGTILSSDHVNYLIWRYLQERGYGRAAVQLMRDWGVEPQNLDFAPAVKPNMLISILQDGLTFDELLAESLARDSNANRNSRQPSDASEDARRYSFLERRKRRASEVLQSAGVDPGRKRPRLTNGSRALSSEPVPEPPQPSRPVRRRSSVAESHINGDAMVVDDLDAPTHDTKPASPDDDIDMPVDEPSPPIISTLELGTTVGVQSDHQLTPVATTIAHMIIPSSDILHVSWSRSKSTQLLVTGNRVFRTLSVTTSSPGELTTSKVESTDHFGYLGPGFVTQSAPASAHDFTAIALEQGHLSLDVFPSSIDGSVDSEDTFPTHRRILRFGGDTVIVLRWNASSSCLLSIAVGAGYITLSLFDTAEANLVCDLTLPDIRALDAVWISESQFLMFGEGFISMYTIHPHLQEVYSLTTPETWTSAKWDQTISLVACTAEIEGVLALLKCSPPENEVAQVSKDDVHMDSHAAPQPLTISHTALQPGQITSMEWQPLGKTQAPQTVPSAPSEEVPITTASPNAMDTTEPSTITPASPSVPGPTLALSPPPANTNTAVPINPGKTPFPAISSKPRLLATSSTDGTVTIYSASHITGLSTLHTFIMGQSPLQTIRSALALFTLTVPALAMTFSPDGRHIAAAGDGRICVWRAETEGKPVCVWDEDEEEGEIDHDQQARAIVLAAADLQASEKAAQSASVVAEINVNDGETLDGIDVDANGGGDAMVIETVNDTAREDAHDQKVEVQQQSVASADPTTDDPQQQLEQPPKREPQQQPQQELNQPQLPLRPQSVPPSIPRGDLFHILAWDSTGSRLAFGCGHKIRVIALDLPTAAVEMPPVTAEPLPVEPVALAEPAIASAPKSVSRPVTPIASSVVENEEVMASTDSVEVATAPPAPPATMVI